MEQLKEMIRNADLYMDGLYWNDAENSTFMVEYVDTENEKPLNDNLISLLDEFQQEYCHVHDEFDFLMVK